MAKICPLYIYPRGDRYLHGAKAIEFQADGKMDRQQFRASQSVRQQRIG